MLTLPKRSFYDLANYHNAECISLYLPTHRAGMEVNRREDEILFKNQLKNVAGQLENRGYSPREIKDYLQPAYDLLERSTFWNNLSDGLVVFIANNHFKYYTLPIQFDTFIYISDHFYLKPLMPLYNHDGRFFLLALSQGEIRFFEGTRHSITEVNVEDLTPKQLEEVVGFDYKQKFLQFRSAQQGAGGAVFHGHGEGKDDDKEEIKQYFRAVNNGLMKILHTEDAPLLIACVDYLFHIYQEVNDYPHLYPENISGSTERTHENILQERAWALLEPYFQKNQAAEVKLFNELAATFRVSSQLEDILPAALSGNVETLFLQKKNDVYGIYDPSEQHLRRDDEKQFDNASLTNLAAIRTYQQGGKVFLMDAKDMPVPDSVANAIFRY